MSKELVKHIVRETLLDRLKEAKPQAAQAGPHKKSGHKEIDYGEIQRKLDDTMLKSSQVMKAAGLGNPDDATARSLFSKKLRKEKNSEGGLYQFNDEELAKIMKIINNPASYLNVRGS